MYVTRGTAPNHNSISYYRTLYSAIYPGAQNSPKTLHIMIFGPKSLNISVPRALGIATSDFFGKQDGILRRRMLQRQS